MLRKWVLSTRRMLIEHSLSQIVTACQRAWTSACHTVNVTQFLVIVVIRTNFITPTMSSSQRLFPWIMDWWCFFHDICTLARITIIFTHANQGRWVAKPNHYSCSIHIYCCSTNPFTHHVSKIQAYGHSVLILGGVYRVLQPPKHPSNPHVLPCT